ncbi:MAG TPA: acetyl-CoA carboxylase biotin carboxylase subunit [bacterium]|nr:acetyl-CoA carboxylase biotin carboxylase subunit [bacterium]
MFDKILIANRGEIAVRIMRTAREMGVRTVAVYSTVDAQALHVLTADEAVCLGDPEPAQSYLHSEKIIAAAKQTGAQAVHPGYGFLAENPAFAQAVVEAGLTFIGPPASVMAQLGDKTQARRLMQSGGVPIIPGMTSADDDPARLAVAAEEIGYPLLIKAAAGGGGKGMRVVHAPGELAAAAKQAASEAKSAFGDGSIYLEKFLAKPRHVEFQILADAHGNVVHLYERECSIQRRHQKIVEETPSPALDDALRARMGEAAVAAAKAAGYVNAGTVEFLLNDDGEFYFLEVNTRLQVEHPITEALTGLDLVRQQLTIAAGEPLSFAQDDVPRRGHAIECRLYAEDPENNFLPSHGKILLHREPAGPGVRLDNGVYTGFEVPVQYDPILGKLVVWAEDRPAAIARMTRALSECVILGVKTPIEYLRAVINAPAFVAGDTHTAFLTEHFADWRPDGQADHAARLAYALHEALAPAAAAAAGETRREAPSPWQTLGHWHLGK